MASGVRATCASTKLARVSRRTSTAVSFQVVRVFCRSAWVSRTALPMGCAGSLSACSSSRFQRSKSASIVERSNRSVAYSTTVSIPAGAPAASCRSVSDSSMSNRAVPGSASVVLTCSPGSVKSAWSVFWRTSATWKSGWWEVERFGFSNSTRCSKGTSWCAYAARLDSRTRPSNSSNPGSPDVSVRSTNVFTNKPTRSSSASSVRPATPLPNAISVPAPKRVSKAAIPACNTMNTVEPVSRASSAMRRCSAPSISNVTVSPAYEATAGRGRSVGKVTCSGRSASLSRQ